MSNEIEQEIIDGGERMYRKNLSDNNIEWESDEATPKLRDQPANPVYHVMLI